MKILVLTAFVIACLPVVTGCGSVERKPASVINDGIESEIQAHGGNTDDWVFGNGCSFNGSCSARIALAVKPERTIAANSYVARDSRAFLKSEDRIARAVSMAYQRKCFERYEQSAGLFRCVSRR